MKKMILTAFVAVFALSCAPVPSVVVVDHVNKFSTDGFNLYYGDTAVINRDRIPIVSLLEIKEEIALRKSVRGYYITEDDNPFIIDPDHVYSEL